MSLEEAGRIEAAGAAAYAEQTEENWGLYSFEQEAPAALPTDYLIRLGRTRRHGRQVQFAHAMLIFSYGSNMCLARLRGRTPSARPICVASLSRHTLRFHKRSDDGSGKADAYLTNDEADAVWGVVYELDSAEKPRLDGAEGLGHGYEEKSARVVTAEGAELEARLYVATAIDPSLRPFRWYWRYVVEGARQHGLPARYVEMIARQPYVPDPDAERAAANSEVVC